MKAGEFIERVAALVSPVLPHGIVVRPLPNLVGVAVLGPPGVALEGNLDVRWLTLRYDAPLSREDMWDIATEVLNLVQDVVCETYREPWPNHGIALVPSASVEVGDSVVTMCFGDADDPVVRFDPITISE